MTMNWNNRKALDDIAEEAAQKAASIEGKNAVAAGIKDTYRLIAELARASRQAVEGEYNGPPLCN